MELLDFYPSSPVIADRWLWLGELPFTAFGQHGTDILDIRVFEQSVWWVDRYGQEHLLREMTTDYLRNVKTHLVSFGENFYSSACRRYAIEIHMAYGNILGAPEDLEGLKAYLRDKKDPRTQDWFSWLETTELYKALTELLSSRI